MREGGRRFSALLRFGEKFCFTDLSSFSTESDDSCQQDLNPQLAYSVGNSKTTRVAFLDEAAEELPADAQSEALPI